MVFNTKFSLPSFLKQVNKLTENQRNSIKRVGFGSLLHIPNQVLRRSQLIELMDRWSTLKEAFIFPPGEITITLLDVALILGLRVIGLPVVLKEDAPLTNLEKEFGASLLNRTISIESLKEKLESLGERDDESFVRVFLLYSFGTLLFPSANGKVDSRYLVFLKNFDNVRRFAWGAAVLEDLHDCLSQRKSKKTSFVSGCLILLQIWCYEHIIIGRPKLIDCPSTLPRVCRWESSARHYLMSSQFAIKFDELEHTQVLWKLEPTLEEMQIDIIKEIPQECYLRTRPGTIDQPVDIQSEATEEEEPMMQDKSTIFVISDDDEDALNTKIKTLEHENLESKVIADLEKENLELKVVIEELKTENECLKRLKDENEELRNLVDKIRSESLMMDRFVSNLERIVLDDNLDL